MSQQSREIEAHPAVADRTISVGDIGHEIARWLEKQAETYHLDWLLAHADDGVIWGKIVNGKLKTSNEAEAVSKVAPAASPLLRIQTLQSVRLFGEQAELLLWRDGDNEWHARLIRDAQNGESTNWDHAFDEPQMLWGNHGQALVHEFTLLWDGAQGLRHAVPMKLELDEDGATTPPRLIVRHYLNKMGFARVVASRLVDLRAVESH